MFWTTLANLGRRLTEYAERRIAALDLTVSMEEWDPPKQRVQ